MSEKAVSFYFQKQLQKDFSFIAKREQSTLSSQTPLGFSLWKLHFAVFLQTALVSFNLFT